MKVKIAVFGQEDIMNRLYSCVIEQEDIEIFSFTYTEARETAELVEKAVMCDIYLFTGPLSYLYAKEKIDKKRLPSVQVDFDAYMILSSFYHVKNDHNQSIDRLSIDVFDSRYVEEVLHEMGISDDDIYTYSYGNDHTVNIEQIATYHETLWRREKVDYVLTSIHEIEQILKMRGVPVSRMQIPKLNLTHAIEKAKSIATINQSQSAQIVSGYVRIKNFETIQSEKSDPYNEELWLKLHQILLNYSRKTHASLLSDSHNQFVLFGTRSMLDHITNHFRDFPLLKDMENQLETPVDIGFGLGLTAKQAEDNAKLALHACGRRDDGTCFIVNERRDMIGPLGIKKEFNPSALYRSLIHEAKLNNELSYNFIGFIEVRNNEPFSSNDIAKYYGVTKRSAERTIKKLISGNVIKAIGEEKPYVKGRPRKLFKLNQ
ncbi:hypothetical protein SAMN04488072_104202 [Lentibacillus halodurans]|uniref:Transcriptional regulator n=1 Tax=Lentibacillus halodurans TaxID=237679 RepID=A0A1I0X8I2_9BACI|nr:hypothetical protein [Lentibacillus halodurans]SFA96618.1 hypothetical protein SAMN04488072_104202 [Lentibacillus halodurans]